MGESLSVPNKMLVPIVGSTVSIDPLQSLNWTWIPAQAETINATSPGRPGQEMTLFLITSGASPFAITFGTNFGPTSPVTTGSVQPGAIIPLRFVSNGIAWQPASGVVASGQGSILTKIVAFSENAVNTIHTGTVILPPNAWLHNIQVLSSVLWGAASASMNVGDSASATGYFSGVNLKATDLLVGEVLDTTVSECWGGKQGAYMVAATGQKGPVATNFGKFYPAGSNIIGVITVGTPSVAVGRTFMIVNYSIGETIAAVPSA